MVNKSKTFIIDLAVHQTDAFNFKKYIILVRGTMPPDPPTGSMVHLPKSHEVLQASKWMAKAIPGVSEALNLMDSIFWLLKLLSK